MMCAVSWWAASSRRCTSIAGSRIALRWSRAVSTARSGSFVSVSVCSRGADGRIRECYPHRLDSLAARLRLDLLATEGELLISRERFASVLADALTVLDGITGECLPNDECQRFGRGRRPTMCTRSSTSNATTTMTRTARSLAVMR